MLPVTVLPLLLFWQQAMVREGMRNVAAGANPMVLKKGIQKAVERFGRRTAGCF